MDEVEVSYEFTQARSSTSYSKVLKFREGTTDLRGWSSAARRAGGRLRQAATRHFASATTSFFGISFSSVKVSAICC